MWLAQTFGWLLQRVGLIGRSEMTGQVLNHHPTDAELQPGVVVVVKDGERKKWACMRCPGGCGGKVQLSLNESRRPHWTASIDWLGRPTLHPSVRQLNACGCHFWLRDGRVDWCADGDRSRDAR